MNTERPEWFAGLPATKVSPVLTRREIWPCPQSDCPGTMEYNGFQWPVNPPGYHHTCSACGYTVVTNAGAFPRIIHVEG